MGDYQHGENNPNYGNNWTEEQKQNASKRTIQKYIDFPELRQCISEFHKGKKDSEETRKRKSDSKKGKPPPYKMTDEIRLKIGIKSAAKFTDEFKYKQRKKFEENGIWIPLEEKPKIDLYKKEANWVARMFDLIEHESELQLISNLGVYNSKTNRNGVVRDHIYSRRSGFINGVFPEILRHPCNCQILTHSANCSKRNGKYVDRDDITLEELFERIINYKKEWKEQEIVMELINMYKKGIRYMKGGSE